MNLFYKLYVRINIKTLLLLGTALMCVFGLGAALADPRVISMATMATSIDQTSTALATILSDSALVCGVGFTMTSFFKFHQHKLNPTQVPLSQGCTLLMIGAGLCFFPMLLPSAANAVFGASVGDVNKIGGTVIAGLIGSAS